MIVSASIAHLPQILNIWNYEILNGTALYHRTAWEYDQLLAWFHDKEKNNFPVFVAIENDEVVGFASYGTYRPHAGFDSTVEHSLYVKKDCQGKGLGQQLLKGLNHGGQTK